MRRITVHEQGNAKVIHVCQISEYEPQNRRGSGSKTLITMARGGVILADESFEQVNALIDMSATTSGKLASLEAGA